MKLKQETASIRYFAVVVISMHHILSRKRTASHLLIAFMCIGSFCRAQERTSPISAPQHQRILNEYKNKAEEFCAKNLNRFGLYQLQNYDHALDSLFAKEKEDTLAAIQKNYARR